MMVIYICIQASLLNGCCGFSVGLTSTKVIAKIETRTGLNNVVDIVTAADGIILSRGQLGVEIQAEKMFRVQKAVIKVWFNERITNV